MSIMAKVQLNIPEPHQTNPVNAARHSASWRWSRSLQGPPHLRNGRLQPFFTISAAVLGREAEAIRTSEVAGVTSSAQVAGCSRGRRISIAQKWLLQR